MNKRIQVLSILSMAFLIEGCAPRIGASNYSIRGAGEISQTEKGVIVAARPVMISASSTGQDNQPGIGAGIGAISGAVLGSQIGNGKGQVVSGLLGAAAGGVAGHMISQAASDQEGMEYQVRLENGRLITLSQGADPIMSPGQRVFVISSQRDRSRIVPES